MLGTKSSSIWGISIADKFAKDSFEYKISIELPIGSRSFDEIIKNWETKEANLILDKVDKGKTFGCFINCFDNVKFNFIKTINKKDLRVITGFMTGHCGLRQHLHKIRKSDEINCRLCNKNKENVLHFSTECNYELIVRAREHIFKEPNINSHDSINIKP